MSRRFNTIGKGSAHRAVNGGDDCYFTPPAVADALVAAARRFAPEGARWVEPSAGAGVFLSAARRAGIRAPVGYDLTPRTKSVRRADWFTVTPTRGAVVFGNPPFGFAASMALRFFQHAATHNASVIAFVLPASFAKASIQRKLHPGYRLAWKRLEAVEFEFPDGGTKRVPCVLQVWQRLPEGKTRRLPREDSGRDLFAFVAPEFANVAVRRVGGRAGQVLPEVAGSLSTTYFLRVERDDVMAALRAADLASVREHTAGVRSVSKGELIAAVRKALK
jgi:hypothetical protein